MKTKPCQVNPIFKTFKIAKPSNFEHFLKPYQKSKTSWKTLKFETLKKASE